MNEAIEFSKWLADQEYRPHLVYETMLIGNVKRCNPSHYVILDNYRDSKPLMTLEDAYKLFKEGLNN